MPTIQLRVQRFTPATDTVPRFERYEVAVNEQTSVLDALFALQRGDAPDLAFRFSCRVGMCGSCAMVVNGREQLACSTSIMPLGPTVRVESLRNLPIVRDLVVDLAPFFDAYERVLPHFIPRQASAAPENSEVSPAVSLDSFHLFPRDSAEWRALDHQPQCIDCGACWSSCSLVTLHPRYLGPMALHRALQLIADPRDAAHAERIDIVAGEAGAFRCHTLGNCRDVCPRGISPTASIERLKRMAVGEQIGKALSKFLNREDTKNARKK